MSDIVVVVVAVRVEVVREGGRNYEIENPAVVCSASCTNVEASTYVLFLAAHGYGMVLLQIREEEVSSDMGRFNMPRHNCPSAKRVRDIAIGMG